MIRSIALAVSLLVYSAAHAELPEQLLAPTKTKVTRTRFCDCLIYSVGKYRVAEIGSVRVAIKSGNAASTKRFMVTLPIDAPSDSKGNIGDDFRYEPLEGLTQCELAGVRFRIGFGRIKILTKTFPVADNPLLIVIDDGRIVALEQLPKG